MPKRTLWNQAVTLTKEEGDSSWKVTKYKEKSITGYIEKKVQEERDGKKASVTVRCYVDGANNEVFPVQEHIFGKHASLCLLENGKLKSTQKVKGNGFTAFQPATLPDTLSEAIKTGWSYVPYALPENMNESIHLDLKKSLAPGYNGGNAIKGNESEIFGDNPLQASVMLPGLPKEETKSNEHSLCANVSEHMKREKRFNQFTVNINWITDPSGKITSMTFCKTGDTYHLPSNNSETSFQNLAGSDCVKAEGEQEKLGPDDRLFIQDTAGTPYSRKVTVALKDVANFERDSDGSLNVILRPGAQLLDERDHAIYPAINLKNGARFKFIDRERVTSKHEYDEELWGTKGAKFEYIGRDKSIGNAEFSFDGNEGQIETKYEGRRLTELTFHGEKFKMDDPNNKFFIQDNSFGSTRNVIVDATQVLSVYMRDGQFLVGLEDQALLRVPEYGIKHRYSDRSTEKSRTFVLSDVKLVEKLTEEQDPATMIEGDWDFVKQQDLQPKKEESINKIDYSVDNLENSSMQPQIQPFSLNISVDTSKILSKNIK